MSSTCRPYINEYLDIIDLLEPGNLVKGLISHLGEKKLMVPYNTSNEFPRSFFGNRYCGKNKWEASFLFVFCCGGLKYQAWRMEIYIVMILDRSENQAPTLRIFLPT